jgi:hypothetical protein
MIITPAVTTMYLYIAHRFIPPLILLTLTAPIEAIVTGGIIIEEMITGEIVTGITTEEVIRSRYINSHRYNNHGFSNHKFNNLRKKDILMEQRSPRTEVLLYLMVK